MSHEGTSDAARRLLSSPPHKKVEGQPLKEAQSLGKNLGHLLSKLLGAHEGELIREIQPEATKNDTASLLPFGKKP